MHVTSLRQRIWLSLCALTASLQLAPAVPSRVGDLDEDGVFSVSDLYLIIRHTQGVAPLAETLRPYADIDSDGNISTSDQQELIKLILGTRTPQALPTARPREMNPAANSSGIAVTRETILHFSMPLALDAVVDTTNYFATFAGRKLLSRAELSSDRRKATLFYLEPLPSSARITVTFAPGAIRDILGRGFDGDGDNTPGGTFTGAFDTLGLSPVPSTAVVGRLFASVPGGTDANGAPTDVPLQGVTITVDGAEETLRTTTGVDGRFTLMPCPAGEFFVHIDGRTSPQSSYPSGDYYPVVGKKWMAKPGVANNPAGETGIVYLPKVAGSSFTNTSATQPVTVTISADNVAQFPALAGTALFVPANSLFADDGTRGGRMAIAPVAPTRLPSPLPPGLALPVVFTIQTDGATNFDRPVGVCFPNMIDPLLGRKLEPGEVTGLWSFNHDVGDWELTAPMTCTADGRFVKSDPGTGVRQPGWHGWSSGWDGTGFGFGFGGGCTTNCLPGSPPPPPLPEPPDWDEGDDDGGDDSSDNYPPYYWYYYNTYNAPPIPNGLPTPSNNNPNNFPNIILPPTIYTPLLPPRVNRPPLTPCTPRIDRAVSSFSRTPGLTGNWRVVGYTGSLSTLAGVAQSTVISQSPTNPFTPITTFPELQAVQTALNAYNQALADRSNINLNLRETNERVRQLAQRLNQAFAENACYLAPVTPITGGPLAALRDQDAYDQVISAWDTTNVTSADVAALQTSITALGSPTATQAAKRTAVATFRTLYNTKLAPAAAASKRVEAHLTLQSQLVSDANYFRDVELATAGATKRDQSFRYAINVRGNIIRGTTSTDGRISSILPPNTSYVLSGFDPRSNLTAVTTGVTGNNGQRGQLATLSFTPRQYRRPDADADGLEDEAEFILDTNPAMRDSDGDGVSDREALSADASALGAQSGATGVVASVPTTDGVNDLAVEGSTIATIGTTSLALHTINAAGPPTRVSQTVLNGSPTSVAMAGPIVAVGLFEGAVTIINAADPSQPRNAFTVVTGARPIGLVMAGTRIFAGLSDQSLAVIDAVTGRIRFRIPLGGPRLLDVATVREAVYVLMTDRLITINASGAIPAIASERMFDSGGGSGTFRQRIIAGETTLYSVFITGVKLWDVAGDATFNPIALPATETGERGWKAFLPNGSGSGLAVVSANSTPDGAHDVQLYNIGADGRAPALVTRISTPGLSRHAVLSGGLAYVADSTAGLQVINYLARDRGTVAPTIALSADRPLTGTIEEGKAYRLSAMVNDDVAVRSVTFLIDGQPALTDGTFPFEFRGLAPALAPTKNTFTIAARAVDTGGNTTATATFTLMLTPDTTGPTLLSINPSANQLLTRVSQIQVAFDETLDTTTLTTSNLTLTSAGADGVFDNADDTPVIAGLSYSFDPTTTSAYIQLADALPNGRYRVTGTTRLTDSAGNPLTAAVSDTFRIVAVDGPDADADGLPDAWEQALGLNPAVADSDGDGTRDALEDFDNDGLPNASELIFSFSPALADTDGNGVNDGNEDADFDLLLTRQEITIGTDPNKADTDGDSYIDSVEVEAGSNPLLASSTPATPRGAVTATSLSYLRLGSITSTLDHYLVTPKLITNSGVEQLIYNPNDETGKLMPRGTQSKEQVKLQRQ